MLNSLLSAKRIRKMGVRKENKGILENIRYNARLHRNDYYVIIIYQETIDYLEKLGYKVEGKVNDHCKIMW